MKMKWGIKLTSISLLFLVVFVYSCKKHDLKKITGLTFDQNLAVPIGYGEFGVNELLKSMDTTILHQASNGELSLVYQKQLDTIIASEVIHLDDVTQNFNATPPGIVSSGGLNYNPADPVIHNASSEIFSYTTQNGAELHNLNFESGLITINVSTTLKHDLVLIITIPDLTSGGVAVTRAVNLTYSGTVPNTASATINLANLLADFTAGGTLTNSLRINMDATVTGAGNPIVGDETVNVSMNLTNMKFKNLTGYFGQQTLATFTDSMLMKIFSTPIAGNINFTNPKLEFTVDNSFGIPININFMNFSSVNTLTNQTTQMVLDQPIINLAIPTAMGQAPVSTVFRLNNTNTSNISSLVDTKPKYLKYSIASMSNPAGNVGSLNFIESTSKMIIKTNIELPFEGSASDLSIKDTMAFKFEQADAITKIKSVLFRLKVDNGLPLSFTGQAEFVDANYQHVFDLFDTPTQLITGAGVDNTGVATTTVSKSNDITISQAKIALLGKVKYIIISGTADTTPSTVGVKLLSTYKIGFKMSVQTQLK